MSNTLEIHALLVVELPPLPPRATDTYEMVTLRTSGRLFFGRLGLDAASSGDLAGLVAGVDFVDVERYQVVRLRSVRDGVPRQDQLFEQLLGALRGDRFFVVLHRVRREKTGEQGGVYYDEREQVVELRKLDPLDVSSSARLYRPAAVKNGH